MRLIRHCLPSRAQLGIFPSAHSLRMVRPEMPTKAAASSAEMTCDFELVERSSTEVEVIMPPMGRKLPYAVGTC